MNESIKESFNMLSKAIERAADLDTLKRRAKQLLREIEDHKDIICNKCGADCKKGRCPYGLTEASVTGGYFSDTLEDLTCYTFSICEECLGVLFEEFVIPVVKTEINLSE